MMHRRPVIQLKLRATDRMLEIAGWILLIIIWLLVIGHYHRLPAKIPVHFDVTGQADRMGKKWMIWMIPSVTTILFIGLTLLNSYPHLFNYPTRITDENAYTQYTLATRLIRYLKTILVLIFGLMENQLIKSAEGKAEGLGQWFMLAALLLIFIPLVYYLVKSVKSR